MRLRAKLSLQALPDGVAVLLIMIGIVLSVYVTVRLSATFNVGPVHWFMCSIEARDGWTLELAAQPVTFDEYETDIGRQSDGCVTVVADQKVGPDSLVVAPTSTRIWVGSDRRLLVTVEP